MMERNKRGFRGFGIRTGYDLSNEFPNYGDYVKLEIWLKSGSTLFGKPKLIINYTIPSVCGNNFTEPNEQCDDGNTISGDGCSSICQVEMQSTCTSDADINRNNIIDNSELNSYTRQYYLGDVNVNQVSNAIFEHLNGCG